MDNITWIVLIVLAVLNIISMAAYGIDKAKAVRGSYRIPEATLLFAAVLGPVGALAGMYLFHHKTRKPKFYITVPLILLIEAAAAAVLLLRYRGII